MILTDIEKYTPEELKLFAAMMIFQTVLVFLFVFLVLAVLHIIKAIALTRISKKLSFDRPALAWIPFAAPYVEGKICDFLRSNDLQRSKLRIHYLMLSILYAVALAGHYGLIFYNIINQCITILNTGTLDIPSITESSDNGGVTVLAIVVSVLTIVLAFFRMRALFMTYICFNKRKGFTLVMLTTIMEFITPFLYLSVSKLAPVNTSLDKIDPMGPNNNNTYRNDDDDGDEY